MSYHTGANPGEVFVGNVTASEGIPARLAPLKTARLGAQALDIEGRRLPPSEVLPLFIGASEAQAYDRIMMAWTFPNQHHYP